MIVLRPFLSRATRAWLAALSLSAVAAHAQAPQPATGAPDPQALDLELQALKSETLDLTRELRDAEHGLLYPNGSRTSLYVSVKVPGFMLDGISLRINDQDTSTQRYVYSDARALLRDGWHRLHTQRLEPGTYRLQADFTGHYADARGTDPVVRGRLETLFEKKAGAELDLVLPISRNTRLEKPGMAEISRQESRVTRPSRGVWLPEPERVKGPDASRPAGGEDDPRYRAALFDRLGNRYVSALNNLYDVMAEVKSVDQLPVDFQRLLADCYMGFGMRDAAEKVYDRLAARENANPVKMAEAQLELARFDYERGHLNPAEVRLLKMRASLPGEAFEEWRELLTYVLMSEEKHTDVIGLLIPQGGDIDDVGDLPPVLRYNLAVALMKADRGLEGRRLMNRIGQLEVEDTKTLNLRDKANLTLGYQYLQLQNGGNAKALFSRIRTNGPFSNNALLGLGWAEMALAEDPPPSKEQEEEGGGFLSAVGALFGGGDDEKDKKEKSKAKKPEVASSGAPGMPKRQREALERALVPWAELIKRDPMDPAVQEAMLAIPFTLQKLESYEEALKYYQNAIDTLEVARKRMAQAQKSIESGVMVYTMIKDDLDSERGWRWRLSNLADTPETYFMQALLAEHRFMEPLKGHRDGRLLGRSLETWKQRLADLEKTWRAGGAAPDTPSPVDGLRTRIDRLAPRITANAVGQNQVLEATSLKELAGQQLQIEKYLTEARFAVARIFDVQTAP